MRLDIELNDDHAWALAEACKRFSVSDARQLAKNEDETWKIVSVMAVVQKALNEQGYDPR